MHDSIYEDRWHKIQSTDTLRVVERDSIPYEVPVPTRMRNTYDKVTARGFWLLLAFIAIALYRKFR